MKFQIMNAHDFRQFKSTEPFIAIRYKSSMIEYPENEQKPNNLQSYMELIVDDIDRGEAAMRERVLKGLKTSPLRRTWFTEKDAEVILKFINENKDTVNLIVCVCDAGISRSSATAAAISVILAGDAGWVFDDTKYHPNNLIYSTILKMWRRNNGMSESWETSE